MSVTIRCEDPYCQTEFDIDEAAFGNNAMCPRCWQLVPVPEGGPPPLQPSTITTRFRVERVVFIGLLALLAGVVLAILAAFNLIPMESGRANTWWDVLGVFAGSTLGVAWFSTGALFIANEMSWSRTFKEIVAVGVEPPPFQWSIIAAEPLYLAAAIMGILIVVGVATLVGALFNMAQ